MARKKLSIVYITYRPGGLDLLFESLALQDSRDYELIIVDDCPGRPDRMNSNTPYYGVNLLWHGPPKEPVWEHRKGTNAKGIANAMNTGAMKATTDYVVFLQDYVFLHPGSIKQWFYCIDQYPDNTLISGVATVRKCNPPDVLEDFTIWDAPCCYNIHEEMQSWVPSLFENFYMGVPMSYLDRINGIDERADIGKSEWIYPATTEQAKLNGWNLIVDQRLVLTMMDHRNWNNVDPALWHASKIHYPPDIKEPEWSRVSPNQFNFKEERMRK